MLLRSVIHGLMPPPPLAATSDAAEAAAAVAHGYGNLVCFCCELLLRPPPILDVLGTFLKKGFKDFIFMTRKEATN